MADRLLLIAKEEHIELSDAAAELIAQIAGGSLRDAISLLDTCSGLGQAVDETLVRRMAGVADRHYLFAISHAVARGDVTELLVQLNALRETSLDMRRLCEELIAHYRNFLLAAADPSGALIQGMAAEDVQEYTKNSTETPGNAAIVAMKRLAAALERMARSPDPRIDLELALFELCEGPKGQERERNAPKSKEKKEIKAQKLPESKTVESPAPEGPAALDPGAQDVESDAAMPASPKPEAPVRPEQESAAEAIPDVPVPLPLWPQVLEQLSNTDKMLYSYMKDSTAYTDGRRVLIDGGDIFLTFMQDNDQARERIKTVIQLATGRRYGIGPYKAPAQDAGAAPKSGMDTLREWEAKGVEVQYGKTDVEA
jgi:DNA polymerase-3 subunit gamma/tau